MAQVMLRSKDEASSHVRADDQRVRDAPGIIIMLSSQHDQRSAKKKPELYRVSTNDPRDQVSEEGYT